MIPRIEVQRFASLMETRLAANDHKADNMIDVIGYALTLEKVLAKRADLQV